LAWSTNKERGAGNGKQSARVSKIACAYEKLKRAKNLYGAEGGGSQSTVGVEREEG